MTVYVKADCLDIFLEMKQVLIIDANGGIVQMYASQPEIRIKALLAGPSHILGCSPVGHPVWLICLLCLFPVGKFLQVSKLRRSTAFLPCAEGAR